jgi:hypothetical protein
LQYRPVPQRTPHAPQLNGSFDVFTHWPPQHVRPTWHPGTQDPPPDDELLPPLLDVPPLDPAPELLPPELVDPEPLPPEPPDAPDPELAPPELLAPFEPPCPLEPEAPDPDPLPPDPPAWPSPPSSRDASGAWELWKVAPPQPGASAAAPASTTGMTIDERTTTRAFLPAKRGASTR